MPNDSQLAEIRDTVLGFLAEVLFYDRAEIGPTDTFSDLGLDSVLGVELLQMVNSEFGLDERLETLDEHPSPGAYAEYIVARVRATEVTP
jgi:acyl carrier protein